eukprot:gene11070-30599_t
MQADRITALAKAKVHGDNYWTLKAILARDPDSHPGSLFLGRMELAKTVKAVLVEYFCDWTAAVALHLAQDIPVGFTDTYHRWVFKKSGLVQFFPLADSDVQWGEVAFASDLTLKT